MKHKIISIVAGLAMLLNCSCSEDFLETKSTSSVDTDQMFINYKSAMMAIRRLAMEDTKTSCCVWSSWGKTWSIR